MKILIVIANYLPVQNPNVYRWSAIAEHWVKEGKELHILTSQHNDEPNLELINGVHIHRTGHATLKDYYHYLRKSNNQRNTINPTKGKAEFSKSNHFIEKIIDITWRKLYWPDGSVLFIKPAKRLGKRLLTEHNFDLMISVGLPFSCHWIAMHLKEHSNKLKWHMDIQDPFCYSNEFWVNNFKLYKQKNINAERLIFQRADRVSVTNQEAKRIYSELLIEEKYKIEVIGPLYSKSEKFVSYDYENSKINFAYFGSFYNKVRMPNGVLELLRYIRNNNPDWLDDKCFHFFGQQNRFSQKSFDQFPQLKPFIKIHGLIEKSKAMAAMHGSDYLISIGNTTSYHLPSKCVDYLASGRPIINFKSNANDSFEQFIPKEYNMLNLDINLNKYVEQFDLLEAFVKNEYLNHEADLSVFETSYIANQYLRNHSV